MADLFENPMGLDGFEFVEFTAPQEGVLEPVFEVMGFSKVALHRSKQVALYRSKQVARSPPPQAPLPVPGLARKLALHCAP